MPSPTTTISHKNQIQPWSLPSITIPTTKNIAILMPNPPSLPRSNACRSYPNLLSPSIPYNESSMPILFGEPLTLSKSRRMNHIARTTTVTVIPLTSVILYNVY
ncbi:hypothetical protein GIB67_012195 [Kingdonia uniflora]|uniref:Uncharacterized protein n=1 Tax=Kingdonia uniflora TaxID=39325 RepID=A0A7J7NNJ4_9MAGN|nr:hypothetical protein GIB67_012195 [Kingdonia uniflora]